MEKHIAIIATTKDFLGKFERENVALLQQDGYIVHYITNMNEPAYMPDGICLDIPGIHIHHIAIARSPFLFRQNARALRQLTGLLSQFPIQAIHCHTPVGGVLGRLAGRLFRGRRLPVLYTAHGFHFYKGAPLLNRLLYHPVEWLLARYTDILVVINGEDRHSARRLPLRKGGRVWQIPGVGLDRNRFRPLPEEQRRLYRRQMGIGEAQFLLVSVGELNDNKNQRVILEALAKLREAGRDIAGIRYVVCGDGFYRQRMEAWIREMDLCGTVTLYGHCVHIPEILGCADAAAFPSKREGLGMAGLEALAVGIPLLAADNRGTREYMEHGKNGFVYRWDDAGGFAQGIETLRAMPKERRREMAEYCRRSAAPFDKACARAVMQEVYAELDRRIEQECHESPSDRQYYHERV